MAVGRGSMDQQAIAPTVKAEVTPGRVIQVRHWHAGPGWPLVRVTVTVSHRHVGACKMPPSLSR